MRNDIVRGSQFFADRAAEKCPGYRCAPSNLYCTCAKWAKERLKDQAAEAARGKHKGDDDTA